MHRADEGLAAEHQARYQEWLDEWDGLSLAERIKRIDDLRRMGTEQ